MLETCYLFLFLYRREITVGIVAKATERGRLLFMKIHIMLVALLLTSIGIGTSVLTDDIEKNIVTADMVRFQEEHESLNGQRNASDTQTFKDITIPAFNLIRYVTPEEILEIAESGTGLIYFGLPECPWCRQMTPLLIDVALDMGLDVINYIDVSTFRSTWELQDGIPIMTDSGHPRYQDLL